ncbi:hypothetical protein XI08_32320 [Bradyrhizobium sp. CCBAU 11361]|nr:hypothetical protein [Bradyrhizobium sp. CCBAU 11361]
MGGVVVDDEMDVQLGRHIRFDVTQEGEELLVTMAGIALSDDCAVEDIEGREQGGPAMTLVVVGNAFDVAESHRKHGLGSFESLNLTLLIDAKHHGLVRRIELEPDHIAQLLDKEGRCVSATGSERDRVMAVSCVRSSPETVSIAFGRSVRIGYLLRSRDQDARNPCNNYVTSTWRRRPSRRWLGYGRSRPTQRLNGLSLALTPSVTAAALGIR